MSSINGRSPDLVTTRLASSLRSSLGQLHGTGTGPLTLPAGFSGPVLWFRNDHIIDFYIQKLIFGWNGGTVGARDRTVSSFIHYNTSIPLTLATPIMFVNENIRFTNTPVNTLTARKWNEVGVAGMLGSTGGFPQIPNILTAGNTIIHVDGEIVLGPGNTMRFDITPEAAGSFSLSVVGYPL